MECRETKYHSSVVLFSFFLQNLLGVFYILEKVYWDVVVEFVNIVHLCCTRLSGQRENEVFGKENTGLENPFLHIVYFIMVKMYDITTSAYVNSAHDLQLQNKNSKLNIVG